MTRKSRTPIDLATTAQRLAATPDLWTPLVDFDPVSRHRTLLAADEGHEAWLLTWLPGQGTQWHAHGSSAGVVVVLQGQLTEEQASSPDLAGARRVLAPARSLMTGTLRSFGHGSVHRLTNTSADPAVSLHVSSPRLTARRRYALSGERLHLAELQRVGPDR